MSGTGNMAASAGKDIPRPFERSVQEALARTLRHELGDFLQKVYATVAIFQDRLPADWNIEREILSRLKCRAEDCRNLLDEIQDFLCPLKLECELTDLASLAEDLAAEARQKYSRLVIVAEGEKGGAVQADSKRMAQVGEMLLANACEAAKQRVVFRTHLHDGACEWQIKDDGPGVAPELTELVFQPFYSTRAGHAGLGLALARKLVLLHGGSIVAGNSQDGGFCVTVTLPQECKTAK